MLLSLSWLLFWNILLLLFNLVPAFPLDGGRMTRAIVWRLTGEKQRGTRVAAKLGQGFALILAGGGIFLMLSTRSFGGLWLAAIAFLLYQSARAAIVQTALSARIEGVRVADIMDRQPVAIPSGTPVASALDEFFMRYGWSWFPVIDAAGRFLGIARQERLQSADDGGEGWLTVEAVLEPEQDNGWRVNQDRPLTEAPLVRVAGAPRRADGGRRRGSAARRGHRRAGTTGAAGRLRLARPPGLAAHAAVAAVVSRGLRRAEA